MFFGRYFTKTNNAKRFFMKIKYPLTTILVIAIWTVCLIPVPETPLDDVSFIDKWTHFVMYATLTTTAWCEFMYRHRKDDALRYPPLSFTVCPIVMGGLIELAQKYLTTCRSGDVFDFLCNTLGVFIGIGISVVLYRFLGRKR